MSYRELPLKYDTVSREALWGWPNNRVALHRRLRALSAKRLVYCQLTPLDACELHPDSPELEIESQHLPYLAALQTPFHIEDTFERAVCSSRLAVFPTGYHWGWRGIMFVALCAGGPMLIDRPVYEPYFELSNFELFINGGDWSSIDDLLDSIDADQWLAIRAHNQMTFDRYLSPSAVGHYLVNQIKRSMA
jgi:hypothetical protein